MCTALNMKILLRLTSTTERAIKLETASKRRKIHKILAKSVDKYFQEALCEEFRKAYFEGIAPLELARWHDKAESSGLLSKEKVCGEARIPIGTVMTAETNERLKMLTVWAGKSRQIIIDSCLARSLKTHNAPRPQRGALSRFVYPLLSGHRRLTRNRLRWLVENEFV